MLPCEPSSSVQWLCCSEVKVFQSRLSAPAKLSDSGRAGSLAGQELESAATQPASRHAHGSASNMADPGGAGKQRCLPALWGKANVGKEICKTQQVLLDLGKVNKTKKLLGKLTSLCFLQELCFSLLLKFTNKVTCQW